MRIQILGTAAAEGWPALYCACQTCVRARQAGGKNIRSRASLMINDNIKVDVNADAYHHMVTHGLDYSKLEHIVFTHSHNDHLNPGELEYLRDPFAHGRSREFIDIWCSSFVADVIRQAHPNTDRLGVAIHEVVPFRTIDLGDIRATPIIAVHRREETCFNWIFEDNGYRVLYASDTGFYGEVTWEYLSSISLDMVISECTCGFALEMESHMSVDTVRKMRQTLLRMGTIREDAPFVITHFSHNIGMLHDELEYRTKEDGFIVAYDGIVLEAGN